MVNLTYGALEQGANDAVSINPLGADLIATIDGESIGTFRSWLSVSLT